MNKTEIYQLNQWEADDRIRREDFNRDNANIEAGMTALNNAVSQEAQARKAGDEAAVREMSARVDAIPFVKLCEVTATAETQQMNVDLSAYPLEQYYQLIIIPEIQTVSTENNSNILVRCNGISNMIYRNDSALQNYWASIPAGKVIGVSMLQLMAGGGAMHLLCSECLQMKNTNHSSGMSGSTVQSNGPAPAELHTLNFVAPESDVIQPGSKITVFGLKR